MHTCVTSFIHASHTCIHPDTRRELCTHVHTVVRMSIGSSRHMYVTHLCYTCMYMGVIERVTVPNGRGSGAGRGSG